MNHGGGGERGGRTDRDRGRGSGKGGEGLGERVKLGVREKGEAGIQTGGRRLERLWMTREEEMREGRIFAHAT